MPDTDAPSEGPMPHPSRRLVTVLEAYDHELDRLRQTVRANDEAVRLVSFADLLKMPSPCSAQIRSCERELVDQKNVATRWRMKTTFLEKNQRKLLDKIK